jgi:hypothetical protein
MRIVALILAVCVLLSFKSFGQDKPATPEQPAKKPSSTMTKPGTLSEKAIEELQTEWTSDKNGQKIVFNGSFSGRKLTQAAEKKKFEKSGKIPIRITAELLDVKQVNGKNMSKRLPGTARFFITDPDGKVVITESGSLDKMCPS